MTAVELEEWLKEKQSEYSARQKGDEPSETIGHEK